ncbi:MAG TPA: ankyrin repeat domain-containing protein [Thermoanaerobaculia bacterium]|nr:ankyrin repeat domain-containing protein [Thermoanaerobaculia bacterium]
MAAATAVGVPAAAQSPSPSTSFPDRGPRLDADLVRDFVVAGHANLERTRELLEQQPALINATWDWGRGDWETALGGASHMGNPAIAEFLLSHGARMDVFCATMMGKVEIVKAFLADDPTVIDLKGPHGIPLIRHAQAGKQEAIVELLRAHGAKG